MKPSRIKLLCEYPMLLGEVLRRHEARELRRFQRRNAPWWRRILPW